MTDDDRINILKNIKSIADVSYGENSRVSKLADELICSYNQQKPKSKFIPWTVKTIPKGEPLRFKGWNDGVCFVPTFYGSETIKRSGPSGDKYKETYKELFDHFERLDGSPCGDEVES